MSLYANHERPQPLTTANPKWTVATRIFHWGSVLLLIITWVMIQMDENAVDDTYITLHKAFGLSVLFWVIARLINRAMTLKKVPPSTPMPKWQTGVAHLTHLLLYVLILAMPLTAWCATMLRGNGVDFFGLFEIPSFLAENRDLSRSLMGFHKGLIWTLLLTFTGLHIVGALYHQFIQKDNLIKRML